MKILILHGPNMNLIGLRSFHNAQCITLDKINRNLKIRTRNTNIKLKILQTHNEAKAVSFLHRNNPLNLVLINFIY